MGNAGTHEIPSALQASMLRVSSEASLRPWSADSAASGSGRAGFSLPHASMPHSTATSTERHSLGSNPSDSGGGGGGGAHAFSFHRVRSAVMKPSHSALGARPRSAAVQASHRVGTQGAYLGDRAAQPTAGTPIPRPSSASIAEDGYGCGVPYVGGAHQHGFATAEQDSGHMLLQRAPQTLLQAQHAQHAQHEVWAPQQAAAGGGGQGYSGGGGGQGYGGPGPAAGHGGGHPQQEGGPGVLMWLQRLVMGQPMGSHRHPDHAQI